LSLDQNHLASLISIIRNSPPDLIIISEDGAEIMTWKLLFGFFSKTVSELLQNDDHKNNLVAISLPVEKEVVKTLFNMLESNNDHELIKANEAARILGIAVPKFKIKKVAKTFPSELHEEHDDKHSVDENIETLIAVEDCSTKTDDEMAELIPKKVRKKKKERVVSNNYQCDVCSHKHGFASQHLLQKHLLKKHNLQITCPLCNGTFDQYEMFAKHKEICTLEIICHICGNNFKRKASLKKHIQDKHEKVKQPCQYCGEYFQEILIHVKNVHENPIKKCDLCDFQSKRTYGLNDHMKKVHSDVNLQTCEFCGELRKNLKKHIERTKCGQNV